MVVLVVLFWSHGYNSLIFRDQKMKIVLSWKTTKILKQILKSEVNNPGIMVLFTMNGIWPVYTFQDRKFKLRSYRTSALMIALMLFEFWLQTWWRCWRMAWMLQLKLMYSFQVSTLASIWESTLTLGVNRPLHSFPFLEIWTILHPFPPLCRMKYTLWTIWFGLISNLIC